MESKEPVIGSTMPSYGDMSEDDKHKSVCESQSSEIEDSSLRESERF